MRRPTLWPLLVLLPLAFAAGYLAGPRSSGDGERQILYYVDPMNPAFHSPEPGIAPCGMALEPVYADAGPEDPVRRSPGSVTVRPDRQQLIGVTLEEVKSDTLHHTLRLVGRVAVDETREFAISAVSRGWVKELSPATTGSLVEKAEVLGAYYAPDVYTPQYTYIHTYNTYQRLLETGRNRHDNMQGGGQIAAYEKNLLLAQQTLMNLGMPLEQFERLHETGEVEALIELRAPTKGFILARNIALGQWFNLGDTIYRIADLSRVWIQADAFEGDEAFLTPGTEVRVTVPASGHAFVAVVSEVLPLFDGVTRTLKIRLEADNPEYVLRPDMFVDVELPVELDPAIVVPEEAVLDSGTRKLVFVETGPGVFEPRKVRTGWQYGGKVEIRSGLMEGERVVTSGNFLLDSESRMRLSALDTRGTPDRCVICDMDIDQDLARAAGRQRTHEGRTWYFCSERCAAEFEAAPDAHVLGAAPQAPPMTHGGEGAGQMPGMDHGKPMPAGMDHSAMPGDRAMPGMKHNAPMPGMQHSAMPGEGGMSGHDR
ncbi:MAG: efflux RND transporter periplasmic adaptor subunit [Deferrisomatales bacterium]|nr:efflux RND transporter periplasmic adaptor subunit [Deferrisomatales bacterium]